MKQIFLTALSLSVFSVGQAAQGERSPNRIVIMTDDLGYAACGSIRAGYITSHYQPVAWDARWIAAVFEGLLWKKKDPAK